MFASRETGGRWEVRTARRGQLAPLKARVVGQENKHVKGVQEVTYSGSNDRLNLFPSSFFLI